MRKRRRTGEGKRTLGKPIGDAIEIESGSGQSMLQGGFGQAEITSTAEASVADGVGEGAFNASPGGIGMLKGGSVLFTTPLLDGLMLRLGTQREVARCIGRTGATGAERTGGTMAGCEADVNDRIAVLVMGLRPFLRGMALWTGDAFGLPVDEKMGHVVGFGGEGLPAMVRGHGSNHVELVVVLALGQQATIHIAGIEEVLGGQQVFAG